MIRNTLMLLATLLVMACAAPYDMPAAQRAGMEARVAQFNQDFLAGRASAVVDVVPPKMTAILAARAGLSPAALRKATIAQTRELTRRVKIISFGMATDRAMFRQTSAGRGYALIPTQTVVRAPLGETIQSNNTTLAFQDEGKWYLVRIDDQTQRNFLIEAYPEFKGLSVPKGTTKTIG